MTSQTYQARIPESTTDQFTTGLTNAAGVLAYAGALPLMASAFLILLRDGEFAAAALNFMAVYGGVLLAFFGGVRWGVAVMRPEGPTFRHLLGGVIPVLMALPIFFLGDITVKIGLIIIVLPILLIDDLGATRRGSGAPDWYLGVRTPLTVLMELSYLFAFAAYLSG